MRVRASFHINAWVVLPDHMQCLASLPEGDADLPGRYHADIPDDWKVMYVFGGVTMYAALRAMREALARPELRLVTANAIFLAPVPPGPVLVPIRVQ